MVFRHIYVRRTRFAHYPLTGSATRFCNNGFPEMNPTDYKGSQIELYLQGSDDGGWTANCIVTNRAGEKVTLDPTEVFATKELAGQSAFTAACAHVDAHGRHRAEIPRRRSV